MPTAIVTGATGILGREIVKKLGADPKTWSTVHAISRSQKEPYPQHVQHSKVDLLTSPEEIATQLANRGVEAEYLFFAAYMQRDDEQEMTDLNGDMIKNFLTALSITGAEKKLKRVVLTTGAKHYGVHLGPVKQPMEEDDPWVEGTGWPPNFYYRQQRVVAEMSASSSERIGRRSWDWVVTYPNDVIGVAEGNFMNLTTALGLYASVSKELNEAFQYPGSPLFYTKFDCFTSSRIHAEFNLWAALNPDVSNQAFNVHDGDAQSWQTMWPRLAAYFDLSVPKHFVGDVEKVMPLADRPPLSQQAEQMGIQDQVPQGEVRMNIDLIKWAGREDVKQAWNKIAERDGLKKDAFEKATWPFLNFVLGRNYDIVISMNKARKFGWQGWSDTWEELEICLQELEKRKVLPPK